MHLGWTEGDFLVFSQGNTLFRLSITSTSIVVMTILQDLEISQSDSAPIMFNGDHLGNRYFFVTIHLAHNSIPMVKLINLQS